MVVLTIFAIIGIAACFAVGYWAISKKCPKAGDKIADSVDKIFGAFKRKDSQTVDELNKLDKE
jgi:hypothetical protein